MIYSPEPTQRSQRIGSAYLQIVGFPKMLAPDALNLRERIAGQE